MHFDNKRSLRILFETGQGRASYYGRSQVYGPATACLWNSSWNDLDDEEKDKRMPWQGENHLLSIPMVEADSTVKLEIP